VKSHDSLSAGLSNLSDSPFIDPIAVDTWDAWFRWREHGALRDLTVNATWDRVATALTSIEPADAAIWKERFTDAFRAWRLLLDERILATAGTGSHSWASDGLAAVLNAAAFIHVPLKSNPEFDVAGFENAAALAVRALDNAVVLLGDKLPVTAGFRIGVIGLADALALFGLDYDSVAARAQAATIARSLAQGCLRGSLQLGRERDATVQTSEPWRTDARARNIAAELIDEASEFGIRHRQLTAITSQPKLALFANNVADALNPSPGTSHPRNATSQDAQRRARGLSANMPVHLHRHATVEAGKRTVASASAQQHLRAAVQRWIDEPITYPVLV